MVDGLIVKVAVVLVVAWWVFREERVPVWR